MVGLASEVEEVGGFLSQQLEEVACCHALSSPIRNHANRSILKCDVLKLVRHSHSFFVVELRQVAMHGKLLLPIERVIINTNVRVVRHECLVLSQHKRIDLNHLRILFQKHVIQVLDNEGQLRLLLVYS